MQFNIDSYAVFGVAAAAIMWFNKRQATRILDKVEKSVSKEDFEKHKNQVWEKLDTHGEDISFIKGKMNGN